MVKKDKSKKELSKRQLIKRIKRLKKKVKLTKKKSTAPKISPLAPTGGFPNLPEVLGVRFASGSAQVRYKGRDDVMLAEIAAGSAVAGVFTKSLTRAAPVLDCESKLKLALENGHARSKMGLVVNSGNANAFTGGAGDGSVRAVSRAAAEILSTTESLIFTASTGVIGEPLPHAKIIATLGSLGNNLAPDQIEFAASAIRTTDTFAKGASATAKLDGREVTISGIAKGSGMIAPDMATMLVFIFTDVAIDPRTLQKIVSAANRKTFNCITVDGDTSTSDSLLVFATGAAGNREIKSTGSKAAKAFAGALQKVMLDLAHLVVRDGEGATKFIEIEVNGAVSDSSAQKVGLSIANSPLVKTAFAGEDPNWGRIVMAVGKSGEQADRDKLSIRFGEILVAEKGWVAEGYVEDDGTAYMKSAELSLSVDLGVGTGSARVWTCDLTHGYIQINADYRS